MAVPHGDVKGILLKRGYKEQKKIGEGSFGKAILVTDASGSQMICKLVDVSKASSKEMADAVKEGKVLADLKHPYIVRYRESFNASGWFCIVMDFADGGDLTKKIETARKSRQTFPEAQVLKWNTQTIMALDYIHGKHILHRDLKPSNLFMTKSGDMKMGDFGISKVLDCTLAVAKTQIGTPYYLSPELCQEKPYTWPSDIWAMGCIVYECCALKVPFDAPNISGLVQKILRGPIPPVPPAYSAFTKQLCVDMLNRNPDRRPSTDAILEKPQIKAIIDEMKPEEEAEPAARPSAAAVPASPRRDVGGYAAADTFYRKGDLVEYNSSAHKTWLPASVINVDGDGRIVIDLKPNTFISREEQAGKIRPRKVENGGARGASPRVSAASPRSGGGVRAASPMVQRSPSIGARAPSPMNRPGSRGASPSPMMQRSPSGGGFQRPPSRGASPSGGMQRTPSGGVGSGAAPSWGPLKKGDLVEYFSSSHKDWLPATVINADGDGRIIIDLKPNTWISKEEQASKIRDRRGRPGSRPPSRGAANGMVQRSPSVGSLQGGRAQTPSRAASPRRALSSDRPSFNAESPRSRQRGIDAAVGGANGGTPRVRPPGLPPGPRVSDSPLRAGGRNIAGGYGGY